MATALDNIPVVQNSSPSDQLKALIHAGSLLAGNSKGRGDDASKTLQDIAISRLHEFNSVTSQIPNLALSLDEINEKDLGELKSLTAQKSLGILEHIQALLREHDVDLPADNRESNSPQIALGTRDLTVLRTLASVVFGWGTTPLLVALYPQVGSLSTGNLPDKSILIPEINLLTVRLVSLIWPSDGGAGTSSQSTRPFPSHITKILTTSHVVDILRLGISIGWLPEPDNQMQEMVYKLLKMLPASQAIVSLGSVSQPIRASPESGPLSLPAPPYLQKATSGLLSQQVLRPDGVSGLCAAVFGEADEVAPLVKLERIARVLGAVPSHMNREVYMRTIIPNIITLLSPPKLEFQSQSVPTSYRQAAAFTLSRLFKISKSLTLKIASPMIHGRFFYEPTPSLETPSLSDTITTLTTLFTSTDPSPFLAQVVIEPILVPLYNLLAHLDAQRISDPTLKELARGLIKTWARLVGREEAVEGLWSVIQGTGGWGVGGEAKWCWDVGEEGLEISKTGPPKPIPLSVLQGPDDNGELGDEEDDNPLSLRPAPTHFGELLKSLERKDVASAIFVKTLNAYQASKVMDTDPLKILLYLRLILEMQQKLGSSVLDEPDHILQFIAHVIEPKRHIRKPEYLAQDPLRIVEADSDDEDRVDEPQAEDEMVLTAVTLLLALLEANEKMSTLTSPLLAVIFDYIEPITNHNDESLRSLAREARLVLISRRSIAEVGPLATDAGRPALQTYQEALRLIQDPILPVRAHGLHMLRQLVVPPKPAKGTPPIAPPELNAALIPAILDVFLQSIQEEDSFVFLNAVQGLSAMANRLGREIIQNLVRIYADGVESGHPIERAEMDKRVRVGEALVQVVRSCGDALGNYVDMLVPSLFRVTRAHNLPTILRSSALSILSQCVETSPVSVTGWTEDILSGMLDILQLESVQAVPLSRKAREEARQKEETKFDLSVDSNPQEVDSKLPPLRRSALVCFALVVRSMVEGVYEDTRPAQLGNLRSKAITVLEYKHYRWSNSLDEQSLDWM
ncbi:unnamed protein product [Rhizoctonia solani]|uniref:RNA polymerase II assembly factor Rtp1 C-terminal domain-containing protein n=1 Tax=Rhizoctonia solani TaxID=456999 RepID=A0A8H2W812_9AGAM|nr:unnamed protein product [Rhizoctonia solani]